MATCVQEFYPQLVKALFIATGIDSELSQSGLLMLPLQDEQPALTKEGILFRNRTNRSVLKLCWFEGES